MDGGQGKVLFLFVSGAQTSRIFVLVGRALHPSLTNEEGWPHFAAVFSEVRGDVQRALQCTVESLVSLAWRGLACTVETLGTALPSSYSASFCRPEARRERPLLHRPLRHRWLAI